MTVETGSKKRSRKSNREGSSWQEGPYFRWRLRLTVNSQELRFDVSEKSAEARRREVLRVQREIEQLGIVKAPKDLTVGNWLRQWHRLYIRGHKATKTVDTYWYQIETQLLPRLGNIKLGKLTRPDVQNRLIQPMIQESCGARTIEMCRDILRNALAEAISGGLIAFNAAAGTVVPKPEPRDMRVMAEEEIPQLLDAAYTRGKYCREDVRWRTRYAPLLELILNTGPRISEALAIQVVDVNFKTSQLRISKQIEWQKGDRAKGIMASWKFVPTKNKKTRTIDLNADALAAIRHMLEILAEEKRLAGAAYEDNGLLFPSESGRPVHPRSVQRALDGALTAARLPHYGLHDLRRTFGTSLADAGVPPHVLSALMGHEKAETTWQYYIKARQTARRAAVVKLDFRGAGTATGARDLQTDAPKFSAS